MLEDGSWYFADKNLSMATLHMLVKSLQKILVDRSFSRREEFEERVESFFYLKA
jgi:hypothetical protein